MSNAPPADATTREEVFQAEVRRSLRRNYLAHLGHGLLGQTGMRLVNAPTFLPAYVAAISGSDAWVGLARGLQYLGMALSPLFGATLIEHRRRVLPMGFLIGALMRVQILGLALGGLLLPAPWALASACLFLALFGLLLGVQGVIFNFLVSKVIPVEKRGLLMGLRNALSGLTAVGVSIWAGAQLVGTGALGSGYAATFLLAFLLTSVGLALLLFVREPATPHVLERSDLASRLLALPSLLRSDMAFTRYFQARALATVGRMAVPFYVLYAGDRMALTGGDLGLLTAAFVFAQSAGNLAWGVLADRAGFRLVFLVAIGIWMSSVLVLMATADMTGLLGVFVGLGAGLGGFQMSAQNLVLEFGSRRELPMRIAVANTASELVAALGVVAGGLLAAAFSYTTVFWLALASQAMAVAIVWLHVDEPRLRA